MPADCKLSHHGNSAALDRLARVADCDRRHHHRRHRAGRIGCTAPAGIAHGRGAHVYASIAARFLTDSLAEVKARQAMESEGYNIKYWQPVQMSQSSDAD